MLMGIAAAHAGGEAQTVANLGMAIGVAIIIVGAQMAMTTLVICTVRKQVRLQATANVRQAAALKAAVDAIQQDLRELGAMFLRSSGKRELSDMAILYGQTVDRLDRIVIMHKSAETREMDLVRRVTEVETLLSAVVSPNVFDLSAMRDARTIQQQINEDPSKG